MVAERTARKMVKSYHADQADAENSHAKSFHAVNKQII